MSWTNLSFSSGQILTNSLMNQLMENFTAVTSSASGAPRIVALNRAWARFSTVGSLLNSEGVSSVTRNDTGQYTVAWTSAFSGYYGVTFGDITTASAADASVRGFRAFPVSAGSVVVTYLAFNNSANAKEDIEGTVTAWQV